MSKLDDIRELLKADDYWRASPNPEIAARFGVDEGIVRRARKLAEIDNLNARIESLLAENATLIEQLARFRRAERPKKHRKPDGRDFRPLWERIENDEPIPFIPMLGDPA